MGVADDDDINRRQIFHKQPGGKRRSGPAKDIGLARRENTGSVNTLTPSRRTRKVAWPIQLTKSSSPIAANCAFAASRFIAWSRGMPGALLTALRHMAWLKNFMRRVNGMCALGCQADCEIRFPNDDKAHRRPAVAQHCCHRPTVTPLNRISVRAPPIPTFSFPPLSPTHRKTAA